MKSNKCSLFSTFRVPSVNIKDLQLQALTLERPTRDNPELKTLAVLLLDNRLCKKGAKH